MIKIPYTLLELRIALVSFNENKFDEKKLEEIRCEFAIPVYEKKDRNKQVANYHGISLEKLIDSPNYEVLCKEYEESILYLFVKKLIEKFEITEKEAWAVVVYCLGLFDQ